MAMKFGIGLFIVLAVVGVASLLASRQVGHSHDAAGDLALFEQPAAQTLTVKLADISFAPAALRAQRNSLVEVALENTGRLDHDFTIKKIDVDQALERSGAAPAGHQHVDEYAVHVALGASQTARLRLHLHAPGTYTFFCTVLGHEQAGMRGTLVVE
ncbi:MAG: cupredoxin domain-containing protein [Dehalococcoidia bacterium]